VAPAQPLATAAIPREWLLTESGSGKDDDDAPFEEIAMSEPHLKPSARPVDPAPRAKSWIVVASADHVARGLAEGIVQACHGKATPLRRMAPGDGVLCYSPVTAFGGRDRLQAFTAIGRVSPGEPFPFPMIEGWQPFRRRVAWEPEARPAPIRPLLGALAFTAGRANWGAAFRYGLFQIGADDFARIAAAMGIAT
jgi:hypothetical protein